MSDSVLPPRRTVPDTLERRLRWYYGSKTCVATRSTLSGNGSSSADWHHLDDNRANTTFVNLVPLSRDLNLALREAKRVSGRTAPPILPADLDVHRLQNAAARAHERWDDATAFACLRLAYYLATNYLRWDLDDRLALASWAFYHLRQRPEQELIDDVLRRDIFRPLSETATPVEHRTAATVLFNLCGLLVDHGRIREAHALSATADRHARKARIHLVDPHSAATWLRRQGLLLAANGLADRRVHSLLDEAIRLSEHDTNIQLAVANTQAWSAHQRGDYRQAIEATEQFFPIIERAVRRGAIQTPPIAATASNTAEHILARASAEAMSRRAASRRERLSRVVTAAAGIITDSGSMLYALQEDYWRKVVDVAPDNLIHLADLRRQTHVLPNVTMLLIESIHAEIEKSFRSWRPRT